MGMIKKLLSISRALFLNGLLWSSGLGAAAISRCTDRQNSQQTAKALYMLSTALTSSLYSKTSESLLPVHSLGLCVCAALRQSVPASQRNGTRTRTRAQPGRSRQAAAAEPCGAAPAAAIPGLQPSRIGL